jgi:vancomycin aglycone glucosyltransferase
VIIPQMYDQGYWAERVDQLGIGTAHAGGAPTMGSLASALERALQCGVAARAQVVSTRVRTDAAHEAARRLIAAGDCSSEKGALDDGLSGPPGPPGDFD